MIDYKVFLCKNSHKFSAQKIFHASDEIKKEIVEQTSFFKDDVPLSERLKAIKNGFTHSNPPKCLFCGKILDKVSINYCNSKCFSQTDEFKQNLKKVDHKKANESRQKTMIEKYGVHFNSQRNEVKEKLGNHCSSDEFKQKARLRGYKQFPHIDRTLYNPEKLAEMNKTMTAPEISSKIGCSPGFVLHSLHSIGMNGKCHSHSSQETKIADLLNQHFIEHEVNTRKIISPLELDIFIPSKNLGIEINGVYWHSELAGGKDKNYHLNKTLECEKKGIKLLQFWDYEVEQKWEIVKSMILSKCGIYENRIGARTCFLKEIDSKTEKEFLNKNHLQGYRPSSICYGLYFKDELVSLMSFGKSRFNKKIDWELLRFCNKINNQIIGSATRLFNKKPEGSIVSYSDRRYSDGKIYEKLGMKMDHHSSPSYYYTNDHVSVYNRVKFQKHKLFKLLESYDPSKTEWENMKDHGWDRIWDCGTLPFLFNKLHQIIQIP